MRKYYERYDHSIKAMLSGGGVKYVKANETLTFEARKAEIVAIVGESGCGKTTFAKVLMGLATAAEGTITFNGEKIQSPEVQKRPSEQVHWTPMVERKRHAEGKEGRGQRE